jgi:hypothetical protein
VLYLTLVLTGNSSIILIKEELPTILPQSSGFRLACFDLELHQFTHPICATGI